MNIFAIFKTFVQFYKPYQRVLLSGTGTAAAAAAAATTTTTTAYYYYYCHYYYLQ